MGGERLDVGTIADDPGLLPVRMLNEYTYCPRLFHLMHVEGRWEDNEYTADGRHVHRRVDSFADPLPDPDSTKTKKAGDQGEDGDEPPRVSRTVSLGSERLGITSKLDLVSTAGAEAVPVETKRGRAPDNPERSWEPERVQLMAQGLLLREHGYHCDHGFLFFAASRTRVLVTFTEELEARTLQLIDAARLAAESTRFPPPLEDSPKCPGCSLSGICLPDETLVLQEVPVDPVAPTVRRFYPARDEAAPLYIQTQGASVGKSRETLIIKLKGEEIARARLKDVSQLIICGSVQVTTQALQLLCEASVPVLYLSTGHWFYGFASGITLRNAFGRAAQYSASEDPGKCLNFSRQVVLAKGKNQRTLLRRNANPRPEKELRSMSQTVDKVERASEIQELLGLEGNLAGAYFTRFQTMLRPRDFDSEWDFKSRNRRPPRDPINAMLSFSYALLSKECTVAILGEGLDPWWGLFHRPRHGRPALALDLMEEFRPLVADSAVITAVNTGMVTATDFVRTSASCALTASGRKGLIRAFESRLDQLVTHPVFDYRASWRVMIRLQARLLSRWLRGDVPEYEGMVTR